MNEKLETRKNGGINLDRSGTKPNALETSRETLGRKRPRLGKKSRPAALNSSRLKYTVGVDVMPWLDPFPLLLWSNNVNNTCRCESNIANPSVLKYLHNVLASF